MTVNELEDKYKEISPYMKNSHFEVNSEMDLDWKSFLNELFYYEVENDGYTVYIRLKQMSYNEYMVYTYTIAKSSIYYGRPFKTNNPDTVISELKHFIDLHNCIRFPMHWWDSIYFLTEKPFIIEGSDF